MQDIESQLYGLVEAWSQTFNIPVQILRERLRNVPSVETRLREEGSSAPAYAESEVRRACADLIPAEADPTPL